MVCTFSKAPPVAYFRQALDYYNTGVHDAQWYAPANHFGVTDGDAVDFDLLARLYARVGPDGASLLANRGGRIIDRQSGYDLTYSAPKSFSLRYAMANDQERQVLIKALFDAVLTSTDALQKVAGWARRGKAGAMLEAISFTAALFLHDDSRPSIHDDGSEFGDPNVHVHCIILNLAMRKDGTVGAIQSVLLRSAKMVVGAVFHAALAANLARLRLSSDRVGKNGIFEIAGISDRTIKFFPGAVRRLNATWKPVAPPARRTPSWRRKSPHLLARQSKRPRSGNALHFGMRPRGGTTSTSTGKFGRPKPPISRFQKKKAKRFTRNGSSCSFMVLRQTRRYSIIARSFGR